MSPRVASEGLHMCVSSHRYKVLILGEILGSEARLPRYYRGPPTAALCYPIGLAEASLALHWRNQNLADNLNFIATSR